MSDNVDRSQCSPVDASSLDITARKQGRGEIMLDMQNYLDEYLNVLRAIDPVSVEGMAEVVFQAWREGRTVFCCGNGGSASSASHFATDLTKLTAPARGRRIKAMALTESASTISAVGNDIAYQEIFVEQLRAFLEPGDVVIGFSTSGSSPNVLRAIEYASQEGAITLGVTGSGGNQLGSIAYQTLYVSSTSVQHVEDATMVVGHLVCLRVKDLIAAATAPMTEAVTGNERSVLLRTFGTPEAPVETAERETVPVRAARQGN
jgi:D-sedoheptulose 7-phosphate isomerase